MRKIKYEKDLPLPHGPPTSRPRNAADRHVEKGPPPKRGPACPRPLAGALREGQAKKLPSLGIALPAYPERPRRRPCRTRDFPDREKAGKAPPAASAGHGGQPGTGPAKALVHPAQGGRSERVVIRRLRRPRTAGVPAPPPSPPHDKAPASCRGFRQGETRLALPPGVDTSRPPAPQPAGLWGCGRASSSRDQARSGGRTPPNSDRRRVRRRCRS